MAAKNDITGDSIQSKVTDQAYRDNYDAIFRKTPEQEAALKELVRINQELGLYDDVPAK